MKKKFVRRANKAAAILLAGAISLSSIPITVSANTTSFDGDFDSGGFSVWDGVTYDFSWYKPNETEYTISSAAQLAALSILTNDLSGEDYAEFVAELQNVPEEYLALVDTFEGKTITLNTEIDLGGYDFLPISYPWDTPNVTNEDYNALGHVPNITPVDATIGSSSTGDMISTRYYELPEAEMRFRDLLYGVNFDGEINERTMISTSSTKDTGVAIKQIKDSGSLEPEYTGNGYGAINYLYIYDTGVWKDDTEDGELIYYVDTNVQHGDFTETASQIRELTSLDIVASYTYADILSYADTAGFSGTFEGNGNRIKGLHPDTPWTDDPEERLHTYDPIGKGLFGLIGREGRVSNLNVKGAYTNSDVVSYSAFLCAYNYGTIESCYVYGDMEQGLVHSLYPTRRLYGDNGTSTYVLSDYAGTVLPVGNSGFLTAVNNGTVTDCVTAGNVTQAYRQFGFMACTNNGTISNSVNKARFSTYQVETDFITDEWSYTYDLVSDGFEMWTHKTALSDEDLDNFYLYNENGTSFYILNDVYYDVWSYASEDDRFKYNPNNVSSVISSYYSGDVKKQFDTTVLDWDIIRDNPYFSVYDRYVAAYLQGSTADGTPWIPQLYETGWQESVAANHLYGVYGYTAVGGICAVNNGYVIGCSNQGLIEVMHNTSTRNIGNRYNELSDENKPADYYSYIRPTNAYGLFSTQAETINLASGIAALNIGTISGCANTANVIERDITDRDRINIEDGGYAMIMFTPNGLYANDCIVYGAPEYKYNPLGIRWWWTEENQILNFKGTFDGLNPETHDYDLPPDTDIYNFTPYDGNMPYPMVRKAFLKEPTELTDTYSTTIFKDTAMIQLTSGICSQNVGKIASTSNTAPYTTFGITHVSDGMNGLAHLTGITQNGQAVQNLGYYLRNTNVENAYITNEIGEYGIAFIAEAEGNHVTQNEISVYKGKSGYYKLYADDNRMEINNARLYDTEMSGVGMATYAINVNFNNIANFQDSDNGLAHELVNCNGINVFMYGDAAENGLGTGSIQTELTNCNFYGSKAVYALGSFSGGTYTDCHVNTIKNDGSVGLVNHILKARGATINNLTAFADTDKRILDMYYCTVNGANIYGDTPEFQTEFDYRYLFENCDCTDMILQTNINIEWKNPNEFGSTQAISGVLKAYKDTNTFTDCVVQTPNGAVSYPTFNYQLDEDISIKSDALLVYDEDARVSGALAYAMDNGDSENRTYNYTVATSDKEDILVEAESFIDMNYVREFRNISLPAYTRKIQNTYTEKPFYRLAIPFTSNGAGEILGSVERNGNTHETLAYNQVFPTTNIYLYAGETAKLNVIEEKGYGLEKLQKAVGGEVEDLKWKKGETVTFTMPKSDVTILSTWSDLFVIETDDNPNVTITANAEASAVGHTVYVTTLVNSPNTVVDKVWYCKYEKNESNRMVLNTEEKYEIDISEMSFEMPKADIVIFASVQGTNAVVGRFVLAGEQGVIDNELHTITLTAPTGVDLTAIAPEVFETEGAISVSPDVTAIQDFTKPVKYALTAENGNVTEYTVTVITTEDGTISYFEILGKQGEINQEDGTISLEMTSDVDLSNVKPYILWSGSAISEEGYIDLSSGSYVYTVTSSSGVDKSYTVIVTIPADSTALQNFNIAIPSVDTLVWSVDDTTMTISATVPYGTDLSECIIDILDWYGMSTNMNEGDTINLTKCNYLIIKADNGDTITYAIVAKEAPATAKTINQFALYGYDGVIDEENKTITVSVPKKYDITDIAPDVLGFTAKEVTGVYDKQDFTKPVTYTVTAYDGTSVTYTVTINQI